MQTTSKKIIKKNEDDLKKIKLNNNNNNGLFQISKVRNIYSMLTMNCCSLVQTPCSCNHNPRFTYTDYADLFTHNLAFIY